MLPRKTYAAALKKDKVDKATQADIQTLKPTNTKEQKQESKQSQTAFRPLPPFAKILIDSHRKTAEQAAAKEAERKQQKANLMNGLAFEEIMGASTENLRLRQKNMSLRTEINMKNKTMQELAGENEQLEADFAETQDELWSLHAVMLKQAEEIKTLRQNLAKALKDKDRFEVLPEPKTEAAVESKSISPATRVSNLTVEIEDTCSNSSADSSGIKVSRPSTPTFFKEPADKPSTPIKTYSPPVYGHRGACME